MKKAIFISLTALSVTWIACSDNKQQKSTSTEMTQEEQTELLTQAQGMFKTLPQTAENVNNPISNEKVSLGRVLYFDTRLSKTGNNSCNSCHNLATYGVDNKATSTGDAGKNGDRNSPTVFNAALHIAQFWDGRAKDVEEQAGMPVLNPAEMALPDKKFCVERLAKVPAYQQAFKAAFPNDKEAITYDNMTKAIAAFERTLMTPSKFDDYLKGNQDALSVEEKAGLKTFVNTGCTACHNGALLGGSQFMKFGLINDYHALTGSKNTDMGKMNVTKQESDKDVFKVPSLRNIAKTYPYFHDGSVKELPAAVKIMAKTQLNKDLTEAEVQSIVTFLEALTGDIPQEYKTAPKELASFN
jgi:cytochrome c peroxidase